MTKVGFISLGCVKNLTDTEVMLRKLHDAGFEITPDESEAEIIIVNTCGFIESAKQESIDNILDIAWLKKNGKCKHIIATGCLVERYREEVLSELPEVDALVGLGARDRIAEAVEAVLRGEGGDDAHAERAHGGHGLEVGLNAGTAAGIRTRDGEYIRRLKHRTFLFL